MAAAEYKKHLYRYDEAAEFLNVSLQTVRRLVEQGELERIYVVTRGPRITAESLAGFLSRKKRESTAPARPA